MPAPLPAYQFYSTSRLCPSCGQRLLTTAPLKLIFLQGPLQRMGLTCYCVVCNTRYRAMSALPFPWVAWLGAPGRWLWWQTTSLELTLRAEAF